MSSDTHPQNEDLTEDSSQEIRHIADHTQETQAHKGTLWDTLFYKTVLGGDVALVRKVVEYMEEHDMTTTLDWLFQRHEYASLAATTLKDKSQHVRPQKVAVFFLLVLVNIILSPVFYALHILSASWLNRKQKRISENIDLPLVFAVFTQNPDMVTYFLSQGVHLDDVDHKGSNVFHYIADMSAESSECGVEMFKSTASLVHDPVLLRSLLMEQRNSSGMTPVEATAKCGSPILLTEMLRSQEKAPSKSKKKSCSKLELVDVSYYESGSITHLSMLLNHLSDRDVACMPKEDLEVFSKKELLGKWAWLKTKQMMGGVLMFQISDIIITVLMLLILSASFIGKYGRSFDTWRYEQLGRIELQEVTCLGDKMRASSSAKMPSTALLVTVSYYKQKTILEELWQENSTQVENLFFNTKLTAPSLMRFYDRDSKMWNIKFLKLTTSEVDELYNSADEMPWANSYSRRPRDIY